MSLIEKEALLAEYDRVHVGPPGGARKLIEDAPTITPDSNDGWILCSERMPEEREWIGTKRFGTTISDNVYVTFERPDGKRFVKHIMFQNGALSSMDQTTIDAFNRGAKPIAWKPLPEPFKGEK